MNLSDRTKHKVISLLLEQAREKHEALTNAKVSLASTSTSWEFMSQFNGYVPGGADAMRQGPITYDKAQHQRTKESGEKTVALAQKELDEAYAELAEVLAWARPDAG